MLVAESYDFMFHGYIEIFVVSMADWAKTWPSIGYFKKTFRKLTYGDL
jgi:hypothetical protein